MPRYFKTSANYLFALLFVTSLFHQIHCQSYLCPCQPVTTKVEADKRALQPICLKQGYQNQSDCNLVQRKIPFISYFGLFNSSWKYLSSEDTSNLTVTFLTGENPQWTPMKGCNDIPIAEKKCSQENICFTKYIRAMILRKNVIVGLTSEVSSPCNSRNCHNRIVEIVSGNYIGTSFNESTADFIAENNKSCYFDFDKEKMNKYNASYDRYQSELFGRAVYRIDDQVFFKDIYDSKEYVLDKISCKIYACRHTEELLHNSTYSLLNAAFPSEGKNKVTCIELKGYGKITFYCMESTPGQVTAIDKDKDKETKSELNLIAIVIGSVVGAIFILTVIVFTCWCWKKQIEDLEKKIKTGIKLELPLDKNIHRLSSIDDHEPQCDIFPRNYIGIHSNHLEEKLCYINPLSQKTDLQSQVFTSEIFRRETVLTGKVVHIPVAILDENLKRSSLEKRSTSEFVGDTIYARKNSSESEGTITINEDTTNLSTERTDKGYELSSSKSNNKAASEAIYARKYSSESEEGMNNENATDLSMERIGKTDEIFSFQPNSEVVGDAIYARKYSTESEEEMFNENTTDLSMERIGKTDEIFSFQPNSEVVGDAIYARKYSSESEEETLNVNTNHLPKISSDKPSFDEKSSTKLTGDSNYPRKSSLESEVAILSNALDLSVTKTGKSLGTSSFQKKSTGSYSNSSNYLRKNSSESNNSENTFDDQASTISVFTKSASANLFPVSPDSGFIGCESLAGSDNTKNMFFTDNSHFNLPEKAQPASITFQERLELVNDVPNAFTVSNTQSRGEQASYGHVDKNTDH